MNAQTTARTLRPSHFTMPDCEPDAEYLTRLAGYTADESWNGFACPYFTREQGEAVVRWWNDLTGQGVARLADARYDAEQDAFVFWPEGVDEPDAFEGFDEPSTGLHLYPIGAFSWVWWEQKLLDPSEYSLEVHWSDEDPIQLTEEGEPRFQVVCFRMPESCECGLIYEAETDISMRVKVDTEEYWHLPKALVEAVAAVNRILREQAGVVGY